MVQLLQIGKLINAAGQGGFSGGGEGIPAEIGVNAVDFDGTNDYLTRGTGYDADYTGMADGQKGTAVFWLKLNGGDGDSQMLLTAGQSAPNDTMVIYRVNASNKLSIVLWNSALDVVLWVTSDLTAVVADGWQCMMMSWDTGAAQKAMIYIGNTAAVLTVTTQIVGTVDYTVPGHGVGARASGANKLNGCLSQVYFNPEKFIDFAVEANRRKFFSSGGNPVDLGADGSGPTGTVPILFLSGATASWHTNKGSGGGMTENGALTDCATDPSGFPVVFVAAFVAAFV